MSQKTKRTYLFYLLCVPTVALAAVVLRTVALLTDYDATAGYFSSRALPIATVAVLTATAVILAVLTHELRALFVKTLDYRDLPTLFSGIYLGIVLVFFAAVFFLGAARGLGDGSLSPLSFCVAVAAVLCALTGAALFALRAFNGASAGTSRAMLTLALAVLGVLIPLYLYLDTTAKLNEPNKLLAEVVWITVSFFFLGEARIALLRAKWALHTYMTVMTAILSATLSLPDLIYQAVRGTALLGSVMHDFVMLGIFLYSLARLVAAFCTAHREVTEEMQYATDFAAAALAKEPAENTTEGDDNEKAADR